MFKRTHTCGEIRARDEGKRVRLAGWVRRARDLGNLVFVDLRDRYGRTQVVFEGELLERAKALGREDYIGVEGVVRRRPPKDVNPSLPTGEIEVLAEALVVLARSKTPPFLVEDEADASEELRLRYRYLDLRRPKMARALALRSEAARIVRNYLWERGFLEVETPILAKSTPEGARDFLVPSRLQPGKFYALPQSPQLYKQILMVAGVDRYFQLARCLRDEDLRADRQPEHTQIDLEMTLADQEDVFRLVEGMMAELWGKLLGVEIETPFPRLSYWEALRRYGTDKPDARFGMELADYTEQFRGKGFRVLDEIFGRGGRAVGFVYPGSLSRREIDELTELAKGLGAGGLLWMREGKGPLAKWADFPAEGTLLLVAEAESKVYEIAGELRLEVARRKGLIPQGSYKFLWITDFPLFEWNEEAGRIEPMHHVFTSPNPEDLELLGALEKGDLSVLPRLRGLQYDLVLNGVELGSGSVRCHDPHLQRRLLRLAGIDPEPLEFLLEALEFGAPPHAGIALGFDRIVALMLGMPSIRDVIAFPKTTSGAGLMEGSPSEADPELLKELGLL